MYSSSGGTALMSPQRRRSNSMSYSDDEDVGYDIMMDDNAPVLSPPRSARKSSAPREVTCFGTPPSKSSTRILFSDTRPCDPPHTPALATTMFRNHTNHSHIINNSNNNNNALNDSIASNSSSASGNSTSRKRVSRTPMDEDTSETVPSAYTSPRISPNSFITIDGRFVQSKNPFSSPMMTDTPPPMASSALLNAQAAPPLPTESFCNDRSSLLPPRHHHNLQPKNVHHHSPGMMLNGGYPDQRYGFTGSPIPEDKHYHFENSDTVASSGSLNKVRRIRKADDVVSATGHHLSTLTSRMLSIQTDSSTKSDYYNKCNDNDDISPTDVLAFPFDSANTPKPKTIPPPTPLKQRPSKQPYSSVRIPPILNRKLHPPSTPGGASFDEDDEDDEWLQNKSRFYSDFDVIGELGKGSFGTVFKVLSRLDGCMYAIKAAQRQAKGNADRDRMLKEVSTGL